MTNKYEHLQMDCPHCGAHCNVSLDAVWKGDVFLHWNKEYNEAEYDLADSTLDYEDYYFVCDACGGTLFNTWEELEEHFKEENK